MDKPKNRIKEVLEERGIKQTWLAERLGKSFCIGKDISSNVLIICLRTRGIWCIQDTDPSTIS